MSLIRFLNTPCTITRRLPGEEEDSYGREIPGGEEIDTYCDIQKLQRRASEEPDLKGELSDTLWMGYFPAGIELGTGDSVRADGLGEFELVGDPWEVKSHHVEASLRRTAGAGDGS